MFKRIFKLFFLLCPAFSFAQSADGLIADYSFNYGKSSRTSDSVSPKVVGAFLTEDRFGNQGYAWYLNGNYDSYLNLGSANNLKPSAGTISLWVKMDDVVFSGQGYSANPIILTKSHSGDDFFEGYSICYQTNSGRLVLTSSLSSERQVSLHSTKVIKMGRWYHIVMTYDDEFISLYMDGIFEARMAKHFRTRFLQGDSVMVGNSANTKNKRFLNASVDDIKFYNRVIGPLEVSELFNAPDPDKLNGIIRWGSRIFLALTALAFIVALFTYRFKNELEKEKEKNYQQRQIHEMEMQVLKAQMNPHFIFNAMNSVQQFIIEGDNENAHKYLGKFSRLLRTLLESNKDEYISIDNEIEMLNKYIQIEALRFEQAFKYEIVTDAATLASNLKIPQMLIQPVVENAIWHGLIPKKDSRNLSIRFESLNKDHVTCTIEDNGVGRCANKAKSKTSKRKSLALCFIRERLELMRKEWGGEYSFNITDKTDAYGNSAGTRVQIVMPVMG